jgi:hypothetical protein
MCIADIKSANSGSADKPQLGVNRRRGIMKLDMSNSEIEQDAMESEYDEEIMSAGWNPAVEQVCELLGSPADLTLVIPAILRK